MPKAYILKSWQGLFWTMYADRFVVKCRDFLNEAPLGPNLVIPLPSTDASASAAARSAKTRAPQSPAGAKMTVRELNAKNREGKMTDQVYVSFPVASSKRTMTWAYEYEVIAVKGGQAITKKLVFSRGQF